MREVLKSAASFVWATTLFSAAQLPRIVTRGGQEEGHMPAASAEPPPARGRLDTRSLAAIGGGLAAGVGNFAWSEESQRTSFIAQAAAQMSATCLVPLVQAPGLYVAPGLSPQPVVVPHVLQTTVVGEFPLRHRYNNLALPGYELHDCRRRRPVAPLIHRDDVRQTAANLVLGLPALTTDHDAGRPTQLECALQLSPTLAIVELGYEEMLRLALSGDQPGPDDTESWIREYEAVVRALRHCGADVVTASIPNPLDTAACLSLQAAARALRVSVASLQRKYGLDPADRLTLGGLTTAAFHLLGGAGESLQPGGVLRAADAKALAGRVDRINAAIAQIAERSGAVVFDLHALFESVGAAGVRIGDLTITADFLGGFYTINGAYPGAAGHAVIANALLTCLNGAFGSAFPGVDVSRVSREDPVLDYRSAMGTDRDFPPPATGVPRPPDDAAPRRRAAARPPLLRLPPNLEMTLPLAGGRSYHGDAIRVVDCRDAAVARFGSTADVAFGGPVLFDSHLSGTIRIRFSPPQGNLTRFELTFDPLAGDDGVLSAPMFFRWPVRQCRVVCEPGVISGGTLDLATGEVTDLHVAVRYLNSALQALVGVNPRFPDQPILFPGQYGSAWARFDPREDDTLDFTFYGSTFLPLGGQFGNQAVRWALPFAGDNGQFASMPARGMALHPHLQLTTRHSADEDELKRPSAPPMTTGDVPHNQVLELTLFTRRSSFGDRFTLNTPELGGPAVGRSHLLGRLLAQTGEPSGGSIPVAMWLLPPGGLLGQQPPGTLASLFPGKLSPGPVGHDEHLRFPIRNYFLDAVTLVDDPFDAAVGLLDLNSGRFLNQPLHRAFIGQDLFFALIRVEPRTPKDSFFFRGAAVLERDAGHSLLFRQQAIVRVPYPAGFGFPAPDLTSAITVGADSVLDPYLWLHAITDRTEPAAITISRDLESSTGEGFSFRLELLDGEAQPLRFQYSNHAQQGSFRLETVSWFGRACLSTEAGETDVFTFAGFGRWSKDPTQRAHQVAAQIAVGAEHYVSIQIDSGLVSNVNTRPVDELAAMP